MPGRLLRNIPIRRKLVLIIMLAAGGALLLAGLALIATDLRRFRRDTERDLSALAEIVSRNSGAAVIFSDRAVAEDTLAALEARRPIVAAAIYKEDGSLLAAYRRPDSLRHPLPARPQPYGTAFSGDSVTAYRPILFEGERVGTVYLESDLSEMYSRLRVQVGTVVLVFLLAGLAALLFSSGLQRVISRPILHLADIARGVSESGDYSIRANKEGEDELGRLVEAFNEMLGQIQERDSELLKAKEELEQRVLDRTIALRQELAERQRAEEELAQRNAELQRSNQDLDDFAYIASHDLKEPLRGIHNFSSFLLEDYADKLDEDGRSKLETLIRLTRRMEDLIDSLLHFSRTGRAGLEMDDVDLNEVVGEVVENIGINLEESRVEVRIPRPLPTVRCDRVRVRELYHNLIVNAMKYNDKPEKWIEIGYKQNGAGVPPALYVSDNGIGIQEKHHDAIFRIFKRLHARDKFGGGTGAGLTIVKKIVERHDGKIWLDSAYGQGTTIFFTLEKEA